MRQENEVINIFTSFQSVIYVFNVAMFILITIIIEGEILFFLNGVKQQKLNNDCFDLLNGDNNKKNHDI